MANRRVVITGRGLVSPIGNSIEAAWESLSTGRSGVAESAVLPSGSLPMSFAGEAREFTGHIDDFGALPKDQRKALRKSLKLMCRESQMAVAAACQALRDGGLEIDQYDPERTGIVFGSDFMVTEPQDLSAGIAHCTDQDREFDFARWDSESMGKISPLWLLKYLPNMPACHIAIFNDLRGPSNSVTHREASANLAVAEAFHTIVRNSADTMIAGATGTRLNLVKTVHAVQQEQMASNGLEPAAACRPFDLDRGGMVLGEGSGAILLEEESVARARGAKIYGEVIAGTSSTVADRRGVARRDVALANVIDWSLRAAGLEVADVGHVHAHGLSTRSADIDEYRAIRTAFGRHAEELPVTAAKSYFGNLGAGSGMVELICSLLAMEHDTLFPILNYETPDPECPIAAVTSGGTSPGDTFLNLNVTPQGQASSVLIRAWE